MADSTLRLDATLRAACPLDGVSVGTPGVVASVRIDYQPAATVPQRAAAVAALAAFDWSAAAQAAWENAQKPERMAVRNAVAQATADNAAYMALAVPTPLQTAAQIRRLTQQTDAVMRRLTQLD